MTIVNLKTFLTLPSSTVFSKYEPCVFGEIMIKGENVGEIDFYYQEIASSIDCDSSNEFMDKLEKARIQGDELRLDFNIEGRDGLYEHDQLYAVWSEQDVKDLIEKLTDSLTPIND